MPKIQHVENYTPVEDEARGRQLRAFVITLVVLILTPILIFY